MPGPTDPFDDDVVTRRTLDTSRDAPAIGLVEIVADVEGTDAMELAPIYDRADDLVADLFESPPEADADAELEFSYQGYRITVRQDGTVVIRDPSE
ncbi:hypothetical protein Htur_2673 [Haloterrigena turkmenica DSM 5511]|uniref:Halobacterial output domain-containing protein n=1 Tax=Haloterrigena turkmenica (strain ATCC 51198 / DSM 5511 / JCM 9101 / NCIMB 13204 / VKM B-1734 / 4k) TaxID=543526 RepID=D2RWP7_HALTV|nr:HalOD1 output domain-containing protein [Haloterrigena turkmenica]ADB61548.1 hypothetical protein Htur_2673 [Haloterrigena turkmenica DSM 5511]